MDVLLFSESDSFTNKFCKYQFTSFSIQKVDWWKYIAWIKMANMNENFLMRKVAIAWQILVCIWELCEAKKNSVQVIGCAGGMKQEICYCGRVVL